MRDLEGLLLTGGRAVLLSGLSIVLLASATPTDARAFIFWPERYERIIIDEPARLPKKAKKKRRPSAPSMVQPAGDDAPDHQAIIDDAGAGRTTTKRMTPDAKSKQTAPIIPAGPVHVVVSVKSQRASFFANGTLVSTTSVSTGTKSHPTPMGVFSVLQKNKHHVSNLYGAKMPYMQRLTWSGTALHTGPLPGYPASHGCIRLTNDFAQTLWGATRIGARVIVTRDEAAPLEFAHPRLFAPRKADSLPVAANEPLYTGSLRRTVDATGALEVATTQDGVSADTVAAVAVTASLTKAPATTADPAQMPTVRAKPIKSANFTPTLRQAERKASPVSVFISRKDSRLYVRQNMEPLFDSPVTIREPSLPFGTHVFTAMELKDEGSAMRWTVVSIPSGYARTTDPTATDGHKKKKNERVVHTLTPDEPVPGAATTLDRIEIPQDTVNRIAELLTPGSSLIVSDNSISNETGKYTDFIILTR